jgi:hypothetical protein
MEPNMTTTTTTPPGTGPTDRERPAWSSPHLLRLGAADTAARGAGVPDGICLANPS